MSSMMSGTADGPSPAAPGTGSPAGEPDVMNGTVIQRPRRRSTTVVRAGFDLPVEPGADSTLSEPAGLCLMSDLAHAFIALQVSDPPVTPGTGESLPPAEPVRFCVLPEVADAFAALRATRFPVMTKAKKFIVAVSSSTLDSSSDAQAWEVVSSRALGTSSDVAVLDLVSNFTEWSPANDWARRELPGPGTREDPTRAQQPEDPAYREKRHSPAVREHQFRLYFLGSLICNLGTWLQSTAQIVIAYQFTHSVFTVGLIASAQFAGMIFVSPWAAVLASRYSPRAVLIGTQCASAIVAVLMACCYFVGILRLPELFFGALSLGLAYALALPVRPPSCPSSLTERIRRAP